MGAWAAHGNKTLKGAWQVMSLMTLKDLYIDQLRDLYNAEQQLVSALPKMEAAANHKELKEGFREHLGQTREHVTRLDQLFRELGASPGGEVCEAMKGLVKEGEKVIEELADPNVRDAALIAAAQRVEHYEIAGYGTVVTFAKELDLDSQAQTLQDTLDEEGATDKKLTKIAEGGFLKAGINKEAKV